MTESTDTAFRIAVSDAFHKALRESGIVLLEPITACPLPAFCYNLEHAAHRTTLV